MAERTITLPMAIVSRHTVSVRGYSASCMNCSQSYTGGNTCTRCGTVLAFAASEKMGEGVIELMREYADHHGLELIGYSDGGSVMMGGGTLLNGGMYSL